MMRREIRIEINQLLIQMQTELKEDEPDINWLEERAIKLSNLLYTCATNKPIAPNDELYILGF